MKTKTLFILAATFATLGATIGAPEAAAETSDRRARDRGIEAEKSFQEQILPGGLELSGDLGASVLDDHAVGIIGLKATTRATRWLDVGLSFGAVHTLERSYDDDAGREYQAEFAYAAIVLRPHVGLGKAVDIGLPISSGWGLLQFRYEHEYRDEMTWTEEYLDRATTPIVTVGADVRLDFSERFGARLEGGLRQATNLDSPMASNCTVSGPYAVTGVVFRPWSP